MLDCDLEAAWKLQSDFLGLKLWAPIIAECYLLENEPNSVGCLRYVKGSDSFWVHERLLEIDHDSHYMSYRMEDNHFVFPHGYQGYVAKVRLGEAGEGQCWVSWTYEVDPVQTQRQGDITKFMSEFYKGNLKYLEEGAQKLSASKKSDQSVDHKLPASQQAPVAV